MIRSRPTSGEPEPWKTGSEHRRGIGNAPPGITITSPAPDREVPCQEANSLPLWSFPCPCSARAEPSASGSPAESTSGSEAPAGSYWAGGSRRIRRHDGSYRSPWIDAEGENFAANLTDFAERTGIDIKYEGLTDYESTLIRQVDGDDAPDVAQIAQQPAARRTFSSSTCPTSLTWMPSTRPLGRGPTWCPWTAASTGFVPGRFQVDHLVPERGLRGGRL